MEVYINLAPRQTGKTTKLVSQWKAELKESIIVAHSEDAAKYIATKYGIKKDTYVCSASKFKKCVKDRKIKKIYADEWLFFRQEEQAEIYQYASSRNADLICYSTPHKLYNKELFNQAKDFANYDMEHGTKHLDSFLSLFPYSEDLNSNLLIHPTTKIKQTTVEFNYESEMYKHYGVGDMRYKTEILGQLLD